jgi:hypothetical protein
MNAPDRSQKSEGGMQKAEVGNTGHAECRLPCAGREKCGRMRCEFRVMDSELGRFVALSPGDSFLCS